MSNTGRWAQGKKGGSGRCELYPVRPLPVPYVRLSWPAPPILAYALSPAWLCFDFPSITPHPALTLHHQTPFCLISASYPEPPPSSSPHDAAHPYHLLTGQLCTHTYTQRLHSLKLFRMFLLSRQGSRQLAACGAQLPQAGLCFGPQGQGRHFLGHYREQSILLVRFKSHQPHHLYLGPHVYKAASSSCHWCPTPALPLSSCLSSPIPPSYSLPSLLPLQL